MSSLLDLVFNFIRVQQLSDAPVAVVKYANLQAPLVLQNLLLLQRHWAMNLVECCELVQAFSRSEQFERSNRHAHAPLAPLQLSISAQAYVLVQVLQHKYYVYAPLTATTAGGGGGGGVVVVARLNTVLLLLGLDGGTRASQLETRFADFTQFVNSIS